MLTHTKKNTHTHTHTQIGRICSLHTQLRWVNNHSVSCYHVENLVYYRGVSHQRSHGWAESSSAPMEGLTKSRLNWRDFTKSRMIWRNLEKTRLIWRDLTKPCLISLSVLTRDRRDFMQSLVRSDETSWCLLSDETLWSLYFIQSPSLLFSQDGLQS